ncbi:MAG TPA: histidine--tRNA ligase [Jatrophihabitans sp.]|nr:histidine--tRNA ligase [Jatrophihabitans sp.]
MPLSGFPELLPAQRFVELAVLDRLRETFELHGFAPIETPAVESLDQLLRKGEIEKEVYVLRRLHADETGDAGLGLHFDLTVPFARYVLEHAGHLEFPFRRYQIQKAWRGERPQEGRFREFTQADVDIVAKDELPLHYDVEVARVMVEALGALDFLPPVRVQVNNRRLIEGFYRGLGAPDPAAVMRIIDKLDKLPAEAIDVQLRNDAGLDEKQAGRCLQLAEIRSPDASFVDRVRELGVQHESLEVGLDELAQVLAGCALVSGERVAVEADLRIARGLDYYTGTVFETRMSGFESIGSICSGGRYDSLAADGRSTYPGVGISLGVTRMLIPLLQRGLLDASRPVPSAVLVALPDEASRERCEQVARALRTRGIPTEVAAAATKYGRQIRYAQRRGIPFVWFPDSADSSGRHEVKDIRSGAQVAADPDTWQPPQSDLRPQVLSREVDE